MSDMLNVPDTVPTGSATGNPRNKIALKKGRGLMDWVRLGHTEPDLAGTRGKIVKVTPEELAKHNKRQDAWMALRGNVYNVTPYFEYHPGGEDELIRGAGIDATDLFNEVHKWVNFQTMLQKCLIGTLVESKSFFSKPNFLPLKKFGKVLESKKENSLAPPPIGTSLSAPNLQSFKSPGIKSSFSSPQTPLRLPAPKYDWFQTKSLINIAIYTKWKDIQKHHVIVINEEEYFKALVYINDQIFTIHMKFFKQVERSFKLKIGSCSGKVDILLKKSEENLRWSSLGKCLPNHNDVSLLKNKEIEFYMLKILEITKVTHNSLLIVIEVPEFVHFGIPFGFHVYLRVPGTGNVKPYTPVLTPFIIKSSNEDCDHKNIHIYLKVYPEGELTPMLGKMSAGDELDVSFPEGSFTIEKLRQSTFNASQLVLLGAGTGITPHVRLMLEALKNEIKTIMVTFNKTEEDIPWKIELESLVVTQSKLFRVYHVLSNGSSSWKGYKGHISKDLLEEFLPEPEDGKLPFICICGTNGFTKLGLSILEDLGYEKDFIFAFTG